MKKKASKGKKTEKKLRILMSAGAIVVTALLEYRDHCKRRGGG